MPLSQLLITLDSFQSVLLAGASSLKRDWIWVASNVGGARAGRVGGVRRPAWLPQSSPVALPLRARSAAGTQPGEASVGRALLSVECSELGRLAALCLGSVGVGAGTGCGVGLSSRTRTAHLASGLSCRPRGQRALSAALPEVRLDSAEVRMTWGSFWVSRLLQQSLGAWPGPVVGSG